MRDGQSLGGRRGPVIAGSAVVLACLVIILGLVLGGGTDDTAGEQQGGVAASASGPSGPASSASASSSPAASGTDQATTGTPTPGPTATGSPTQGPTAPTTAGTKSARPTGTRTATKAPTSLETVPVEPIETKEPIDLEETGDFGTGLAVEVVRMEAVSGEAKVQGEIAGPAVRVTVKATNNSREAISLAQGLVEVTYGQDRAPGVALSGPGVVPFPDSLAPGKSATATYVYGIPLAERGLVQVIVFYSVDAPLVVFEGAAP